MTKTEKKWSCLLTISLTILIVFFLLYTPFFDTGETGISVLSFFMPLFTP